MPEQKNLKNLFNPKSVAVVGASGEPNKIGAIALKNIISSGFRGQIYPVNPKYQTLKNLPCYKNLADLPESPDLAILAVPASNVIQVLDDCKQKGVKNVVVFAAGYKEIGPEGEVLEKELVKTVKDTDINLLGPNCLGFVNNLTPINATFGQPPKKIGNLRFITQSGAIATSLFDWCEQNELGIFSVVTLGNKATLNENDILEYALTETQDLASIERQGLSDLNPIGLYLEAISDGPKFLQLAKQFCRANPMLLLKPGKTQSAAKAMSSHTGAIAQEDDILQALVEQAGIIRCRTLQEFFDFAKAFSWENLPAGPKVGVVSNAGGPAVVSADAIDLAGLKLPQLDENTKKKLSEVLPRAASLINPVDVLGDALADRYAQAMEILLQEPEVDSLLVLLTPQVMTQIEKTAWVIGEMGKKHQKPIFCSFIGGSSVAYGESILNKYKIPSFDYPEEAISAISAMWKYAQARAKLLTEKTSTPTLSRPEKSYPEAMKVLQNAVKNKESALNNLDSSTLVTDAGIPTPPTTAPATLQEALAFADKNGYPVVLKLSSPKLLHKREVGGIILGITTTQQLTEAWEHLTRRASELPPELRQGVGVQIQKDVSRGVELIVGVKQDSTFGGVLLFGAGGMFAELIADKNLHLLPITLEEAKALVEKSKVYRILKGRNQEPPYALDKLYELIANLAQLAQSLPEIKEVEINPVIIDLNHVWAVDTKVLLAEDKTLHLPISTFKLAGCLNHKLLASKFNQYDFESEQPLKLAPGQYINVRVAPNTIRAYSVATQPDPTHFSLLVDTRPGGLGSQFFENLKPGDVITYMGPFGQFVFEPGDGAQDLLFLATGSGISAIRCMIEAALFKHKITKPIRLYYGLTHEGEIFWQDYWEGLQDKYPNFSYQICLCNPQGKWEGPTGFITKLIEQDYPDASRCSAYMCGHKNMLEDSIKLLTRLGCPKERIYYERFA